MVTHIDCLNMNTQNDFANFLLRSQGPSTLDFRLDLGIVYTVTVTTRPVTTMNEAT